LHLYYHYFFFYFCARRPPCSTLFPYTTLFRSLNLVIVASFLIWYILGAGAQAQAESGVMVAGWNVAFPPGESLAKLVVWLVKVQDRKSTRLNSSHLVISYAVFCLKKKKK